MSFCRVWPWELSLRTGLSLYLVWRCLTRLASRTSTRKLSRLAWQTMYMNLYAGKHWFFEYIFQIFVVVVVCSL